MRECVSFWPAVVIGAVILLSGCVGQPRTFYAEKPIVLKPPAVFREPARPLAAGSAPALSRAKKERLFQEFQRSQVLKEQASTDSVDATP